MTADALSCFAGVWCLDFEFYAPPGEQPTPVCMVARELHSGTLIRLTDQELATASTPPFDTDAQNLFVAYYASAELGCFLALGWPMPQRTLDLFVEFSCVTSGREAPNGRGLLGALAYHGLDSLDASEKTEMRTLAMRGGPYTDSEMDSLLDYCQSDVDSLARLLPAMLPRIDLPRALLRGRYMAAVARIERAGVPIDVEMLNRLRSGWGQIQDRLIDQVDQDYAVYDGRTFKTCRFEAWLKHRGIPWPRHDTGSLDLSDGTFRTMARQHPAVSPLRELRHALSQLRLNDLAVGDDGRNRCLLSPFASRTGRNQPSNAKFIFGPAVWLRGLIRPQEGRAIAYIDWEQQEFGIAAALSGDTAMMDAYASGDPYLAFAKQAGAVPSDATKDSHPTGRERFKVCALAVQYGMGPVSLAISLGQPEAHARELLRLHRGTYPVFWRWSQAAVDHAMIFNHLHTVFGWRVHVGANANPRSFANFPMQANGAEMLRLACCLATEQGILICAPIHDAILIESSTETINEDAAACQAAMCKASEVVLGGFRLRSDAKVVRWPGRFSDKRGATFWSSVMHIIESAEVSHA